MSPVVCLVTTGHLSTNPRLVKEADALAAAGYTVRVVACRFLPWADTADATFAARPWAPPVATVAFGALATPPVRLRQRLAGRVARALWDRGVRADAVALRALHPAATALVRATADVSADLFIAHNLAALPAATAAARRQGARLQFDAEDFHRGEEAETPSNASRLALTRHVEARWMPGCDGLTAASDGIADAYASALGVARPAVVRNVFPAAERDVELPAGAADAERAPGTRTLYWFSQTIGPGRGLEDAVAALPSLPGDVHLALRGSWAPGYRAALMADAEARGVAGRVRELAPVPPGEMVVRAACHDVGLALEPGRSPNNDLALSNKLLTYLVAGIPSLATDTTGQRAVAAEVPEAVSLVETGDVDAFTASARRLLDDPDARRAAEDAARRYTWEAEQRVFLDAVARALGIR